MILSASRARCGSRSAIAVMRTPGVCRTATGTSSELAGADQANTQRRAALFALLQQTMKIQRGLLVVFRAAGLKMSPQRGGSPVAAAGRPMTGNRTSPWRTHVQLMTSTLSDCFVALAQAATSAPDSACGLASPALVTRCTASWRSSSQDATSRPCEPQRILDPPAGTASTMPTIRMFSAV